MPNWIASLIASAIRMLIEKISPELLAYLREQVRIFAEKAKTTANPWDDMAASFLLLILGMSKPT